MSARDRWMDMAKWCAKQSVRCREKAADATTNNERRALRYHAQMYARLASYIRAHPEMPAVQPEKPETRWQ